MTSDTSNNDKRANRGARKGGLGRGLDALIPSGSATRSPDASRVTVETAATVPNELPTASILPNPYQPRAHIDRQQLEELTASIRTHGIVQPLIVTPADADDLWHLIAGERRWRAAQRAGLTRVPVIIKHAAPQEMLELALVENIVRADLNPLEEAVAFQQLIEEFGISQSELAGRVGRSRVAVSNTLRLLNAPEPVKDALLRGHVTEGHARALLGLSSSSDQVEALRLVIDQQLNVRQTEQLVRRGLGPEKSSARSEDRDPDERRVEEEFRQALGTQVGFRRRSGGNGGTLTIQVFSDEEMNALYSRLVGDESW
ncbi:MAG: ParB/RepB/Spo0J family partition protein [Chloroflexia bacterium]|nr:ParB/RepB/Spo0J family partition protein [Chloroflexia bacterium]